jgi:hypothetical protein
MMVVLVMMPEVFEVGFEWCDTTTAVCMYETPSRTATSSSTLILTPCVLMTITGSTSLSQ